MAMKPIEQLIEAMAQDIVTRVQPEKVILFGSYATGAYNDNSDIDLLIVKETSLPTPKRVLEIRKMLSKYDVPKDILYKTPQEFGRFKHIVNTLDYEIETKGVTLYEREITRNSGTDEFGASPRKKCAVQ